MSYPMAPVIRLTLIGLYLALVAPLPWLAPAESRAVGGLAVGLGLALIVALQRRQGDLVAMAGWMRSVTPLLIQAYPGRLINIHPSLLPLHKGLHTHEQALADGVAEHGCTVHFVTPGMDEGPTIAQAKVPVLPGDTAETLAARVLVEEHKLYPAALAMLARGEVMST
eukprot:gene4285-5655_t